MTENIFQKQQELQSTFFIPRKYNFDMDIMKLKKIVSIVGPRRSGKTTYMLQIIQTLIKNKHIAREDVVYIDFNDHIGGDYNFEALLQRYKRVYPDRKPIFFFDEIQEVDNMRPGVFFLFNLGYQIFITGSNSKLHSSELSSHFRGKSLEIQIHNLDFKEYCSFLNIDRQARSYDEQAKLHSHIKNYVLRGGYPEIVLAHGNPVLQTKIAKTYMDIMIYKDLMERYKINNEYVLKFMIQKLIASNTKQINISKLNNELKSLGVIVDKNLLYTIFDHLESVFFIDILKQQYKSQGFKKSYILDNIYQTIYQDNENLGQKFENTVYHNLKNQDVNFCYRSDPHGEIDFIDDKGRKTQVCRELNDENIIRESSGLGSNDLLIFGLDLRTKKNPISGKLLEFNERITLQGE